jgi:hypothetical protein
VARTLVVEKGNCGVPSAVPTIGRMVVRPRINPETVEVLLDTTWRTASAETARTDALDRKAATLATFASLLTSLTATLGFRFLETTATLWAAAIFSLGLLALVLSVALAVVALLPREYLALGMAYLERFPTWSEIRKEPEDVRGDTMRGLIAAVAREREANDQKVKVVRYGLVSLLLGLVLIAGEAATNARDEPHSTRPGDPTWVIAPRSRASGSIRTRARFRCLRSRASRSRRTARKPRQSGGS